MAAQVDDLLAYSGDLGGCFNLFRASDRRIEAATDATKSNSVYVSKSDRLWVLSSRAILAHMIGSGAVQPEFDLAALVTMPSKGYIVGSGTPYGGVSTLGVAEQAIMTPRGERRHSAVPVSEAGRADLGLADWDRTVSATADALVRAFDPLAGGDVHLALTGGRDSRVIAAALAHHTGIGVTTHTMGVPRDPDVILAAEIAALSGWSHEIKAPNRSATEGSTLLAEHPIDRITRVLDVHDAMNSAWDDIEDYGDVVPLPIMSGVGGEILRGGLVLTSHARMTPALAQKEVAAALGNGKFISQSYVSSYGLNYVGMAETSPFQAIDDFYYHERNGRWVASRRMGARFRRRVIDPLLDNRFIRETRQIDPSIRWAEMLAFELIDRLHPSLRDLRMEGNRWRFEREQPHPLHAEGWGARGAIYRDPTVASFNWKNLTDPAMRARVDEVIRDGVTTGAAAELLDRQQVETFLASDVKYPGVRWHLATTTVMLLTPWWRTARRERRESIEIRVPAPAGEETELTRSENDDARPAGPLVSVIVPMYNAERFIHDTLESLAAQSLLDFEVIVVDDGSTDRSSLIVDEFAARDDRFSRVDGPAVGSAGAARNVGLDIARGEYLAFLDADDLFAPSMLEKLYRKAKADEADVVLTGFQTFDDTTGAVQPQRWALRTQYLPAQTPFPPSAIADHLFYVTNPSNWNKLFRRAFVDQQGIRFQPLRRANDAYFTFISLATAQRVTYVSEDLVLYRVGNSSSLQGSIQETPLEFLDAIAGIHDSLRSADLDGRFRRAFINLIATMSLGALARASSAPVFLATYSAVRETLFPKFAIAAASPETFLTANLARRVAEVLEKPADVWLFDRVAGQRDDEPASADGSGAPTDDVVTEQLSSENGTFPVVEDSRPDVSVVVPVYNSAAWLHECLLSILAQSGVSMEVICVNDGSTDDSSRILREYATSDSRVIVVDQPNAGLSAARNTGLDLARGRYVCLIDSDDYWRIDELAEFVDRADRDALDVLLFDADSFFEPGVSAETRNAYATYYARSASYAHITTGVELIASMREKGEYRASACLYLVRMDLIRDTRLRFIPGIVHEDNPFTFALLMNANRVVHENVAMYARRVRPGSIMTTASSERSLRGYVASYLEMNRHLAGRSLPSESATHIGDVVHQMYASARRLFIQLPAANGDRVLEAELSPEAHCTYLMLRYDRGQAQKIRRLAKET
ncbi:glycosyltransferase [Microbacterium sp. NPDC058389]|uniref:glycosyltransferase n=1 Tax=Microbacterium sp. NPDC058389 TaxID=3346475 RepID=UPI00364878AA